MAVYRGKIDIVNMSNITATAGVGIQSSRTLYVISNSGNVPPDLVDVTLSTTTGDILTFASTGATFKIIDDTLWAWQNEQEVALSTNADHVLVGIEGWSPEVPEVGAGQYLWSKTIYTYTNGTQTITYGVFRQGADGKEGPQGPAGVTTASYRLSCSQSEILKFVDTLGNTTISPEILTVSVLKDKPTSEIGYIQIVDLDINNFVVEVYNINTGTWTAISSPNIISLDDGFNFSIDLKTLIEKGVQEGDLAASYLLSNECILKISYTHYEETENEGQRFNLVEFLNVRYSMNKDMAQLSVKANGIVASMQDSKMVFDANGLMVQNGSFIIKDSEGNSLLYSDNGNLALKGNVYAENGYFKGELQGATGTFSGELVAASGTFSGKLEAATGSFSGDISAASGTIGGFKIDATRLISTDNEDNPSIILDGKEGTIEAENIILGTGAQIKEYIKIGDQVELRRVATSIDSFIKVVNNAEEEILALKADGTMSVGYGDNTIIISGADGSIISQNFYDGLGWKISNTESIFNDVTVRGSIRASVLEYGETQAIGGALLVRPSSRILKVEVSGTNTLLTLEETRGFNIGDYCRIDVQTQNSLEHKFFQIISIEDKIITVSGDASGAYGKPIVNFGQTNEDKEKNDNVGISINGSTDNSFSTPQSISVFDFNPETKIITPRIVLGKLPNEESIYGYAAGTYGLYAENVLLKGSLVTQTDTTGSVTYSGISTLYGGTDSPNSINTEAGQNFKKTIFQSTVLKDFIEIEGYNLFKKVIPNIEENYILGAIYIVKWDNINYEIECKEIDGKKYLGNESYITNISSDSILPFALILQEQEIIVLTKSADYHNFELMQSTAGEILLWAGATGTTKEEVETSKFFVDRNGNLFAGSGYFKGTIITDATITASAIETAILRGSNEKPGEPALRIEDAAKGIYFTTIDEEGKMVTVFEVSKDSIVANVPNFTFNSNFTVGGNGSLVVPNLYVIGSDTGSVVAEEGTSNAIMFDKKRISYMDNFSQNELTGNAKGFIDFSTNLTLSPDGVNEVLELSGQEVRAKASLYLEESIKYNELMEYKPVYNTSDVLIGYDLYIE